MKKILLNIFLLLVGIALGAIGAMEFAETEYKKEKQRADSGEYLAQKHMKMFLMMNEWLNVKQKGKNLSSYFKANGYKRIAIYGMGYVGNALMEELKDTDVQIAYGIDQKADSLHTDINVITIDDPMGEVDIIVITAIASAEWIKQELSQKVDYPCISIAEIIELEK